MEQQPPARSAPELQAPIRQFSGSHDGILRGLNELAELPGLAKAVERARTQSAALIELFDKVVLVHHADEEQELFVSVQRSCRDARECAQVQTLVDRLKAEHRRIEALWAKIRPALAHTAAGKVHGGSFAQEVDTLVRLYGEHARLEEEVFLPLADRILGRNANHMAALDIALHLRHAPPPRTSYI
jgi:hemerythrin-like domain-containing protein